MLVLLLRSVIGIVVEKYVVFVLGVTVLEAQAPAKNYCGDVRVSKTMFHMANIYRIERESKSQTKCGVHEQPEDRKIATDEILRRMSQTKTRNRWSRPHVPQDSHVSAWQELPSEACLYFPRIAG